MQTIEFKSGVDETVRGVLREPEDSGRHPAVILVHGLLSAHDEFGDYPDRLTKQGYVTLAIDMRGHGQSEGVRGFVSQDRMIEDVRRAIDHVLGLASVDPKRVALFGHSLGGSAAVCAAAHDSRVTAVVAGAIVGRIRDEIGAAEMLLYRVVDFMNRIQKPLTGKSIYLPYRVTYKDIFVDPAAAARAQSVGFLQHSTPADNIPSLLKQDAITCARNVHIPALIIWGDRDQVVKESNPRSVYDALPGEKEWYLIKGSGHSFATDCQKDVAFSKISDWLDKHLA